MARSDLSKRPAVGPVDKIFKGPSVETQGGKLEKIRQRLGGTVSDGVVGLVEVMGDMKTRSRAPDEESYQTWERMFGLDRKTLEWLWGIA